MRVARYFVVPEDALEQYDEYNNQYSAFGDLPQDEPFVVLKLIKPPKVKEVQQEEVSPEVAVG